MSRPRKIRFIFLLQIVFRSCGPTFHSPNTQCYWSRMPRATVTGMYWLSHLSSLQSSDVSPTPPSCPCGACMEAQAQPSWSLSWSCGSSDQQGYLVSAHWMQSALLGLLWQVSANQGRLLNCTEDRKISKISSLLLRSTQSTGKLHNQMLIWKPGR